MIRYNKYRLLKDLPDGSIVGDEYECGKQFNFYFNTRIHKEATAVDEGHRWDTWQVENNPKFFELIKEEPKEWEVESIIIEFDKRDEPMVVKDRLVIYNFLKDDERYSSYKIHSVKRISDGEVFTVGDELCELGMYSNEKRKITSIELINGTIGLSYGNGGVIIIQAAKKSKPKEVFTWDDALACEWAGYLHSKFEMGNSAADITTILPQWKEKKQSKTTPLSKEIIEVTDFYYECSTANGKEYVIATNKTIPNEKHNDIIKAIEAVLNNDVPPSWVKDSKYVVSADCGKTFINCYTQEAMDKAREQTWEAAKTTIPDPSGIAQLVFKYPTLESYLNHISKTTKE